MKNFGLTGVHGIHVELSVLLRISCASRTAIAADETMLVRSDKIIVCTKYCIFNT